jgi:hypothetical protein
MGDNEMTIDVDISMEPERRMAKLVAQSERYIEVESVVRLPAYR